MSWELRVFLSRLKFLARSSLRLRRPRRHIPLTPTRDVIEKLEPRLLLSSADESSALQLFSTTPALFVENQGQWPDPTVRFAHQGQGANIFMTDAGHDDGPPGPVTLFSAAPKNSRIDLTWSNPADPDLIGILLIRGNGFTPLGAPVNGLSYAVNASLGSGTVVFSGAATNFSDFPLVNGSKYYYAAYAFDSAYNYSYSAATTTSAIPVGPLMLVSEYFSGFGIANGDTTPDFGSTDFGFVLAGDSAISRPFQIRNIGTATLNFTGTPRVQVIGSSAFTARDITPASISVGSNTGFIIRFQPTVAGIHTATISIATDDARQNPFTFTVQGELLQKVVASANTLDVPEGSSADFAVRLSAAPAANVTVTVVRMSGDTDLSAAPASLVFTPTDWDQPKTVTLSAAHDADPDNGTATFYVTSPRAGLDSVIANEVDDDIQGLVLSTSAVSVTEGSAGTFKVKLAAQPIANVDVGIARQSGDVDLSANPLALTFTPLNWNIDQTITISAAEDPDPSSDSAIFAISSAGLPTQTVSATELDNDNYLILSTASLTVPEGATDSLTVKLAAAPMANAVVAVLRQSGDSDLTAAPSTLIFTTANWNTPQSVTITAAQDLDAAAGSALFAISSPGLPTQTLAATEQEDDTQSLILSAPSLSVLEAGANTFTVKLAAQPPANVTVTLASQSGDPNLTLLPPTLTFTPANWNTPQSATISAAADPDAANGSALFSISSPGLPTQTITATEQDDDTQSLLLSTATLSILEGATSSLNVRLAAQPLANVTVSIARQSGDTDLTASPTLTFTPANWNINQPITLTAAQDPDTTNGSASFSLSSPGLPAQLLTATELDDDALNLVLSTTALAIPEGYTNTFTVRLSALPPAPVTVTIARDSGDADLSTATPTLTFLPANWNIPQLVTLTADNDPDASSDSATFSIASPGLTTQFLTATEQDDNSLAIVLSTATLTIPEGASNSLTVRLSAQPPSDLTITITNSVGDVDLTNAPATILFTPENWNVDQSLTFTAAQDADFTNGSTTFLLSPDLPTATLIATEAEDDVQDLTPPTVKLKMLTPPSAGKTPLRVVATITDNIALNLNSIGHKDLILTGPGRYQQFARLLFRKAHGAANATPVYQFTPRGGLWDSADNGLYTLWLAPRQITDAAGNTTLTRIRLARFKINLPVSIKKIFR